jgi:hypothetical protein
MTGPESRLSFRANPWHEYRLDGKRVPSVTGILGHVGKAAPLMGWAVKETAAYALTHAGDLAVLDDEVWLRDVKGAADRARDKAAADGTMLHTLAETLIDGHPMPEHVLTDGEPVPVPGHVRDMATQLARFLDAWDVQPVLTEAMVFHDGYQYAGRIDLVADLADGHRWLLDYKTSQSGIWPRDGLQLTAYERASHYVSEDDGDLAMAGLGIEQVGAVWVRPDAYELVPVRHDDAAWSYFLHAGAVADWSSQHRKHWISDPLTTPEAVA